MPASLVELAAIDMRSTPLDRLTAVQESLDQVHSHLREAVLETLASNIEADCLDQQHLDRMVSRYTPSLSRASS